MATTPPPAPTALNISSITSRIQALKLNWVARENELTVLASSLRNLRLGAIPPAGLTLAAREATSAALVQATAAAASYPATYDARTAGWVTPIEDQGGCGSCVAFGSIATFESAVRIMNNDAGLAVDLSEAQTFYCYGKAAGATCETGWWPDGAFNAFKTGVVDAACFPYTAGDQSCNLCSNSADRMTAISGWTSITNTTAMKTQIATKGPVTTCFTVYNDFFSYSSGTYSPDTASGVAGGHCVCVVGYSDPGKYWICKNSWGTGWGESGFFCIAYGVCGIDAEMWAINSVVDTGWRNGVTIQGLWAIDQDFNAWAYLSSYGWKKLSNNTDNIFYDMLSQVAAAKAAGHSVSVHLTNGVIDQIYS
jgi:C1A family cysteine protease